MHASSSMQWNPGDVIGSWVVDRYLRSGWTGSLLECHLARNPKDQAVIKICDVPDGGMRMRFGREGTLLLKLSHPGIVPIRSAHFDDDPPYLVLEAVSGEDLHGLIERQGALLEEQALSVALRVVEVLVYLHGNGRFHRDLKPSSVLVDGRKVQLTDFGIARESSRKGLTEPGTSIGSVEYAPPEWAKGKVDPKGWDLYALGVLMHEMLTGAPAFTSSAIEGSFDRAVEIMSQKRKRPHLDPGPNVGDGLRNLVKALTATDPGERPASAVEVEELLNHLIGPEGPISLPPAPIREAIVPDPPIRRKQPPEDAAPPSPERAPEPEPLPPMPVAPMPTPVSQGARTAPELPTRRDPLLMGLWVAVVGVTVITVLASLLVVVLGIMGVALT
ncbi:MAG: serine/threonine protein kinase [Myxococcales bacterium]|nr:serine/threonine protein kinase [Myxococcales bacterium]